MRGELNIWYPDQDDMLMELRNKGLMFHQIAIEMTKAGFKRTKKSCAARHRLLCGDKKPYKEQLSRRHINWPNEIEVLACHRPWTPKSSPSMTPSKSCVDISS